MNFVYLNPIRILNVAIETITIRLSKFQPQKMIENQSTVVRVFRVH